MAHSILLNVMVVAVDKQEIMVVQEEQEEF
jgi:hypothetical protein